MLLSYTRGKPRWLIENTSRQNSHTWPASLGLTINRRFSLNTVRIWPGERWVLAVFPEFRSQRLHQLVLEIKLLFIEIYKVKYIKANLLLWGGRKRRRGREWEKEHARRAERRERKGENGETKLSGFSGSLWGKGSPATGLESLGLGAGYAK